MARTLIFNKLIRLRKGEYRLQQPLVSIVVPVYNVEKYLDRCLESITKQTYKNLEIILVDDGSPDNCPDMCDEWAKKDSRIKVVHKQNQGLGMARNTGIDNATGEYICFFDSDDYIKLSLIEKCVNTIIQDKSQVVIFGSLRHTGAKIIPAKISDKYKQVKGSSVQNELLPGFFTYDLGFGISAWMQMFRLSVIKDNKILFKSERDILSEDAYFALEIYKYIDSVSIIPEHLYYYCKNDSSLTMIYKKEYHSMNNFFLLKSLELCEKLEYNENVKLHIKARYRMYALSGMKQIISANIPKKEKKAALKAVFQDEILISVTTKENLKLDGLFTRLFWILFRKNFYYICYIMLWYKTKM